MKSKPKNAKDNKMTAYKFGGKGSKGCQILA